MRYVSVCSGIEAASVAWEPLGWEPVAFSEIEPFPAAVLKHRWPEVPNHGDMTKHEQWNIPSGSVDLLVGGTPCQSFSVAGLRHGLNDPRGGLMLTFLKIAQRLRPRWVVWENVPGVLSSNGGRDFGSFLGALGELGYGWSYRVLDAQWFGVAQRRRRVFVVGHLGNWELAAKVLFESESVRRDTPPSREAGQGVAANAQNSTGNRKWPASVASTLNAAFGEKQGLEDQHALGGAPLFVPGVICASDGQANASINQNLAPTLTKQDEQPYIVGALDCRIGAQRAQKAQAGHYIADCQPVADTITACFYKHHGAQGGNDSTPKNHIVQSCVIPIHDQALYENHPNDSRVTGPHDVAPSCVSRFGTGGGNVPLVQEAVPMNIYGGNKRKDRPNGGFYVEENPQASKALDAANGLNPTCSQGGVAVAVPLVQEAIAFQESELRLTGKITEQTVCPTLKANTKAGDTEPKVIAFEPAIATREGNESRFVKELSPTLRKEMGDNQVAVAVDTYNQALQETAIPIRSTASDICHTGGVINPKDRMAVRRLTPKECERLQGFPDDHTLIPWRNKPADQCPDGPRYKTLGNSMAVPCMRWIGKRIARAENERQGAA